MNHQIPIYIKEPMHPISVNLIGCGGTGSQVLTKLAQIHLSLISLGHLGLHVTVFDEDVFTESNVGRQACFMADVGLNKAEVCVTRINRTFGLRWDYIPMMFNADNFRSDGRAVANITISCVDSVSVREEIANLLHYHELNHQQPKDTRMHQMYWIDSGNGRNNGQVIMGTVGRVKQPKSDLLDVLPDVLMVHPDMHLHDTTELQGESCSLAESLEEQDITINPQMAVLVEKMVWMLFRKHRIDYHGIYVNLDEINMQSLKTANTLKIRYAGLSKKRLNKVRNQIRKEKV